MESTDSPIESWKMQIELKRMTRLYAMLSHINRTIVRTEDAQELYLSACRIAIESGGFLFAWIGLSEPGSRRVKPVAAAGSATVEQLATIDLVTNQGLTAHSEQPLIVNDTLDRQLIEVWRNISELWGVRAYGSFPIRLEERIIGTFNVASAEPGFFCDAEFNLLVEVADDISFALDVIRREEKRIVGETKMRYLAYYDSQTGMPSRALFEELLTKVCKEEMSEKVVVLVSNIRRYHGIVQLLGSCAGQKIIRAIAVRLESALSTLPVARISESEFAVILINPAGLDVAEELAWQMHKVLDETLQIEGQELFLDPFIGIAVFPQDGDPLEVLNYAMQAAAGATSDVTGPCRFFFADMDGNSRKRLSLDTALRRALERNEFILHYQPQVDLASGRVIGAEALLRWRRPDQGLVSPLDFIPQLEANGLIVPVGEWVLYEACRKTRQWQIDGLPFIRIAVNLSSKQYYKDDVRALVRRCLNTSQLDPQWLELELTESIVLLNANDVIRTMHDLNSDGISHALDDFGTGYSSLSYLQRLPVARIKIDRSFVINITSNPSDAAIVRAMIGMAHSLGLSVIAEGVETEGQLRFLSNLGCEEIQGYFFSRPLSDYEFSLSLREGRAIPAMQINKSEQILLLVDDDINILSSLSRVLRRKGYRILSTTNAREGFELLANHRPGVVLCDQRMPEMTGTEFLRRVKELYPDTMRIVLSGYTELNSVIDAVNHGAIYKFITKPWEDEALCETIKDAFRIYELHRENSELSRMLRAHQTHV